MVLKQIDEDRVRDLVVDLEGAGTVRERLFRIGAAALTAPELLGLVLRDGAGREAADEDAFELSRRVLDTFGGVRRTASRTVAELMEVPGIGTARAERLKATFGLVRALAEEELPRGATVRASRDIFERYGPIFRDVKREEFHTILLDGKNRVIREERVSMGSLTASIVHPREVFNAAIRDSPAAVVFVHTHPSGDPEPSAEDLEITDRLVSVGRLLGIRVLD
ncbi:MAG: DNA repair protein RadC, partial [Planctomycetota bacterium]